jgi:hypothetical protein|tara:strand:- start:454 stop:762 length:309 start_codon:yes stop_codon:yes gene_type:complete
MSSLARKQRRGKADQNGNKIPKRPFNNSKRTKGTKSQEDTKESYEGMKERFKHVRALALQIREAGHKELNDDNMFKIVRQHNKFIMLDEYEVNILKHLVNNE